LALKVLRQVKFATIVQIKESLQTVVAVIATARKKKIMAECKCGKCAACKKRMADKKKGGKKMPPWIGSKADEKQDKKLEKGMTPAQKKKFEAEDKKHDKKKGMSKKEDMKGDKKIADKIKSKKK
jgi:hypothetical protein